MGLYDKNHKAMSPRACFVKGMWNMLWLMVWRHSPLSMHIESFCNRRAYAGWAMSLWHSKISIHAHQNLINLRGWSFVPPTKEKYIPMVGCQMLLATMWRHRTSHFVKDGFVKTKINVYLKLTRFFACNYWFLIIVTSIESTKRSWLMHQIL